MFTTYRVTPIATGSTVRPVSWLLAHARRLAQRLASLRTSSRHCAPAV